jgi:hypothetical protein
MMRALVTVFLACTLAAPAQFAPPAGQPGSTAMYKDSTSFVAWAETCTIVRGKEDAGNTASPYASVGDSSKALGIADNTIVSLGDGGSAVCSFAWPLADGPGPDFAVFENSFSDDYLEFAFVEVSSDGLTYFRLPATSNIQDTLQTGPFDLSDATKVNNLAGKYRGMYGTPFDLQELQGTGGLDLNNVTHVRIVDVVGSLNPAYASYDMNGRKINDPWPTAFPSSGFDLDAIGVIHDILNSLDDRELPGLGIYPNPATGGGQLALRAAGASTLILSDMRGVEIWQAALQAGPQIVVLPLLSAGVYYVRVTGGKELAIKKLIIE